MFEECLGNLSGEFQIWYKRNKKTLTMGTVAVFMAGVMREENNYVDYL